VSLEREVHLLYPCLFEISEMVKYLWVPTSVIFLTTTMKSMQVCPVYCSRQILYTQYIIGRDILVLAFKVGMQLQTDTSVIHLISNRGIVCQQL
jgi:hypothetical protein